jgi:hypothetical protein
MTHHGGADWPKLELAEWSETYAGLHLRTQIVGKTRLACAPPENHWWHCTLYLTARGLSTSPIPCEGGTFDVELDLVGHKVVVRTSAGAIVRMPLRAQSIAEFYQEYQALLRTANVDVALWGVPVEMADPVPFAEDGMHRPYDRSAADRCFRVLALTDRVLKQFKGRFLGKCSPSHFWWGAFDIACTRFSGRRAPRHPGGVPNLADHVAVEGYSHECISAGWWPGNVGGALEEPAFYAYAYPEPAGCENALVEPRAAFYHQTLREWILPYEAVRTAADPEAMLLLFLQSTYDTAASAGGWDPGLTR